MICRSLAECFLVDVRRDEPGITAWRSFRRSLTEGRVLAVVLLRIAQYCASKRFFWRFATSLKRLNEILTGFECSLAASLGDGLFLAHTQDVVVGEGVRLGRNVTLYNGVTLGARARGEQEVGPRYPTVGDGVIIYSGAKILGPVEIGNESVIGANAVVLQDVPVAHVAVGVPARILKGRSLRQPTSSCDK